MPENKYQRVAKLLWMFLILFLGTVIVFLFFTLAKNGAVLDTNAEYERIVLNADSVVGEIEEIGDNFIRLVGQDIIYFYDGQTEWKEKDVRSNEYVNKLTELSVGDRVVLKVGQVDADYYIYEVRKEPSRSVAGLVIEIEDNTLTVLDFQEKRYEINTSANTSYFSITGDELSFGNLFPGNEIIVTSYGEDLGDIITADLIEVVS